MARRGESILSRFLISPFQFDDEHAAYTQTLPVTSAYFICAAGIDALAKFFLVWHKLCSEAKELSRDSRSSPGFRWKGKKATNPRRQSLMEDESIAPHLILIGKHNFLAAIPGAFSCLLCLIVLYRTSLCLDSVGSTYSNRTLANVRSTIRGDEDWSPNSH